MLHSDPAMEPVDPASKLLDGPIVVADVARLDVRERKIGKEAPPQPSSRTRDFR